MLIIGKHLIEDCPSFYSSHCSSAIEISIVVLLVTLLVLTFFICNKIDEEKFVANKMEKLRFSPPSINEEFLLPNALISYYEQREELIARQKILAESQIFYNESGYTSIPSTAHTPRSLYECTGFASMENFEVTNPLFLTDVETILAPAKT